MEFGSHNNVVRMHDYALASCFPTDGKAVAPYIKQDFGKCAISQSAEWTYVDFELPFEGRDPI